MIIRKKGCKRFISILLSLMIIMSGLTLSTSKVSAEVVTGHCGPYDNLPSGKVYHNNVMYSFDSDTGILTISGEGGMENYIRFVNTPFNLNNYNINKIIIESGVTSIGNNAFGGLSNLTEVEIADTVTTIGDNAFSECKNLANVTSTGKLKNIGYQAFKDCWQLTSIDISNVTTLGSEAFYNCGVLKDVTLSNDLKIIESNIFYRCTSLESLNIPSHVTVIKDRAFTGKEISNPVIPASIEEIGKNALANSLSELVVLSKDFELELDMFELNSICAYLYGYEGSPTEELAKENNSGFMAFDENFTISTIPDQPVTGYEIKPKIIVKDKDSNILNESDYNVSYANNMELGTASVTVTRKDVTRHNIEYEYEIATVNFNIVPVTANDVTFADVTEGYTNPEKKEIVINNNGDPIKDITGVSLDSGSNSNFTISEEDGKYYIQPKSNLVANDNGDSKTYSDTIKVSYADGFATADVSIKVNPIESNVTVTGGTTAETSYARGKTVTIKANDPKDGYTFDQWVVTSGGVTLNNESDTETTFIMGGIPVEVKATYKDIQKPTIAIKEGTNDINNFLNGITFGLFFKETKEISIEYSDNVSVATKQYYIADKKLTDKEISNITWKDYSAPISIEPNSKQVIYAKAVDSSGNTQIVNSNGIVIYTDSQQDTASIEYIKNVTDTLDATVTLNGNKINKVKNGDTPLSSEDYSVDGNKITFHKSFLSKLPDGDTTLTISYSPMDEEYQDITGNDKPDDTTITVSVRNPKTYVITYEQNGGTGDMTDGEATEGTAFTMPECTIKAPAGYTFKTWAIGSKDSKTIVDAGKTYTFKEATKVYPIWEAVSTTTTATTKPTTPTKVAISKASVSKIKAKTYTGYKKKPSVTVKYNEKKLKKGTDYTVSYKNNTKVGTAKVIIKGKGNYTGTKTVTFKIKKRMKVAKGIYKVNSTGLYGHKSPHKVSPVNMYFKKGDKVTVTKIGKKVGKYIWVKVKMNKKTSYVYSKYLKL